MKYGVSRPGYSVPDRQYDFKVYVSSPPSLILHVRGGIVVASGLGDTFIIPSRTIDFSNSTNFSIITTFSNSNYYRGVIIGIKFSPIIYPDTWNYYTHDLVNGEFATDIEAEEDIDAMFGDGIAGPWVDSYPVCAVVLKNNGTTGSPGQILPIDGVNRGRSYLWKDVRRAPLFA